ncbi:MAG: LTA synthase family protein [Fibrobacter sp.]|uniref:LTA synthase family protein n=1 Tax=Fibrobacter sp. TaxID=35828 RepID=UPI0025C50241|nr:LTA synthase family protein [Fibrobacter sp.]MBR4785319.1 LTA synthase family protein [Fibrobacter sp.]
MFLFESIDVLMAFFPLENLDAVVFTLTHNVDGTTNLMWLLLEPCLKTAAENTFWGLAFIVSIIVFFLHISCKKKSIDLRTFMKKLIKPVIICIAVFCLIIWLPTIHKFPLMSYIEFYGALLNDEPIYNSLYEEDYVHPDSIPVTFDKKRNLILVFLESVEGNFQDKKNGGSLKDNLIPDITEMIEANVSFLPGGMTVEGTGWTMAETIAKTCGIPLQEPIGRNRHGIENYLKKAVCLTDVLQKNGYEIKLVQGTDIAFASMDFFANSHGIEKKNIYDLSHFLKKNIFRSDKSFFESIKDADLYNEVKNIANDLGKQNKPWMLWFFTMDTHGPYGRIDSNCVEIPLHIQRKQQYPFALRCASKHIKDFVEWAKIQDWFENTTIVVMGDHPAMIAPEVVGYPQEKIERYWVDFFVNSEIASVPSRDRQFTSFDMFPTILEAMGVKVEGRALGLGRSLFSEEKTLIEKYGKDSLNALIKRKGTKYKSFWD